LRFLFFSGAMQTGAGRVGQFAEAAEAECWIAERAAKDVKGSKGATY